MPTPHRFLRVARAIHRRQLDVTLFLDQIHNPHNISAILRTADAVGVGEVVWCWDDPQAAPPLNPEVAQGAERWVNWRRVPSLPPVLAEQRATGATIVVADVADGAVDHRAIDWTRPVALVMGNEHQGCTPAVTAMADRIVTIPMNGFAQSLNVSVAAAVLLFEIQRQRQAAGLYDRTAGRAQVEHLFAAWDLVLAGFRLEDLLTPPDETAVPTQTRHHRDGRR